MGILDKFKRKEENFDNLPYLPDDPSLPPLPPQMRGPAGQPALPPPPPRDAGPGELPELPPLPRFQREENQDLPPMPQQLPPLPEEVTQALPELEAKGMLPRLPEPAFGPAMPQKTPKVFVQLNKYKEIVNTVSKMESRINELQNAIGKMKDIRAKENDIIESWNNLLTEAKIRIEDVNSKLPSTEGL